MKVPAIAQEFVRIRTFPGAAEDGYDALWDLLTAPDGKIYCGVSCEGLTSRSARLYAYDPGNDRMELVFKVADVTHPPENVIPQSKIHTSLALMENGRLIMCTHTTVPAPTHPIWAPWQCYHDLYEGYPGSHIIVYDPKTNDARDMGIPAPRDSNYGGGCYVAEARQYFMLSLLRHHLYAFNLNTNRTRDLGYVGVGFRLFRDRKGMVYGIAPTGKGNRGRLYRYDPFTDILADVDVDVPGWDGVGVLSFVEEGPDGKFYLARLWSDHLMVFDPEHNTFADLGPGFPGADRFSFGPPIRDKIRSVAGIRFLPDGKLYYGMVSGSLSELVALMRWDIFNGGQPEFLGFVYGDGQATVMISEMVTGLDGKLYLGDTCNYGKPPRLVAIDAVRVPPADKNSLKIPRRWHDPVQYAGEEAAAALTQRSGSSFVEAGEHIRVELYDDLLPANDCAVRGMAADADGGLHIATAGGCLVKWDGRSARVICRHKELLCGLDVSGGWAYFADRRRIWRYPVSGGVVKPELWAELPGQLGISSLRAFSDGAYGLSGPGFRPFTAGKKVRIGPETGKLAVGFRTVVLGPDGHYYGAGDEACLFAFDPAKKGMMDLDLRLPGLKDRYFLARLTAAVVWDGFIFGGTSDGYLFRLDCNKKDIRNLGKPALSLGIQDLVVSGGRLYGIAGRGQGDPCRLFSYASETGFQDVGMTGHAGLACLAALPDGRIAVGGAERIAHVDIYRFAGL